MTKRVRPRKVNVRHPNGRVYTIDQVPTEPVPFVPKVKVPSEALECSRFVAFLKARRVPFTHVPNENKSKAQRIKNARLGTSAGFPDYIVFVPGHVVFVEMKRRRGGRLSVEQKEWISTLQSLGHAAYVCAGFDEARKVIESYYE